LTKDILGIFVSKYDTAAKAKGVVAAMKNCPHLVLAGTAGNTASMSFIVPESLRWWFEGPAENPDLLGAKKVSVFIIDEIAYPDRFEPRLPETKLEAPPCGSNCLECPMRQQHDCPGCPATVPLW
jgi:hypothetical protein